MADLFVGIASVVITKTRKPGRCVKSEREISLRGIADRKPSVDEHTGALNSGGYFAPRHFPPGPLEA